MIICLFYTEIYTIQLYDIILSTSMYVGLFVPPSRGKMSSDKKDVTVSRRESLLKISRVHDFKKIYNDVHE